MRFLVTSQILLGIERNSYLMPPSSDRPSKTLQTLSKALSNPLKHCQNLCNPSLSIWLSYFLGHPQSPLPTPLGCFVLTSFNSITTLTIWSDQLSPSDDGQTNTACMLQQCCVALWWLKGEFFRCVHISKSIRPSVCGSVGPSNRWSDDLSVTRHMSCLQKSISFSKRRFTRRT